MKIIRFVCPIFSQTTQKSLQKALLTCQSQELLFPHFQGNGQNGWKQNQESMWLGFKKI